jgi:lactoylglutathione lyase
VRTLHVGLRVDDLDASIAFYRHLGYEVVGRVPETGIGSLVMLKLPDDPFVTVELVHRPGDGPVTAGALNHLVVQVEELRATLADLEGHGITAGPPSSPDGTDTFLVARLTDPSGHEIELVQWPPGHPVGMTSADLEGAPPAEG